jgi:hypothetical protein
LLNYHKKDQRKTVERAIVVILTALVLIALGFIFKDEFFFICAGLSVIPLSVLGIFYIDNLFEIKRCQDALKKK